MAADRSGWLLFIVLVSLNAGFCGTLAKASDAAQPPGAASPQPEGHAGGKSSAAETKGAAAGSKAEEGEKHQRTAPRRVTLPAFQIVTPHALQESLRTKPNDKVNWPRGQTYEFSKARFSIIVALASWSQRAVEVALRLQGWTAEFNRRSVAVVGIFTHDSAEDLQAMVLSNALTFPVGKVDLAFVAHLLNPKVPSIWVVDHNGQIVFRTERPTDEQLEDVRKKVLTWTDF